MIRRVAWVLSLGVLAGWSLTLFANSQAPAGTGGFKPVSTVAALMSGQDDTFQSLGKLIEDPQAKNRMNTIFLRAELLAELANVNTMNKDAEDYRNWAITVRETSLELAKEAKKKKEADETKMKSLHKKIEDTCQACHDKYK